MKLTYNEPKMKISKFSREDIVTTSGENDGRLEANRELTEAGITSIQQVDFSELRFIW